MFEYTICNQANEGVFYKQCEALEKNVTNIQKGNLIQDVDSSLLQYYDYNGKKVIVYNDKDIGAVYVKSEIDLLPFFRKSN